MLIMPKYILQSTGSQKFIYYYLSLYFGMAPQGLGFILKPRFKNLRYQPLKNKYKVWDLVIFGPSIEICNLYNMESPIILYPASYFFKVWKT